MQTLNDREKNHLFFQQIPFENRLFGVIAQFSFIYSATCRFPCTNKHTQYRYLFQCLSLAAMCNTNVIPFTKPVLSKIFVKISNFSFKTHRTIITLIFKNYFNKKIGNFLAKIAIFYGEPTGMILSDQSQSRKRKSKEMKWNEELHIAGKCQICGIF